MVFFPTSHLVLFSSLIIDIYIYIYIYIYMYVCMYVCIYISVDLSLDSVVSLDATSRSLSKQIVYFIFQLVSKLVALSY